MQSKTFIVSTSITCFIIICVGSVTPIISTTELFGLDKLARFCGYTALSLFPALLLKPIWRHGILALLLIAISGTLEIIQHHIPGRDGSLDDLIINSLGIIAGIIVSLNIKHMQRRKARSARKTY
jgi:VanZ family protein